MSQRSNIRREKEGGGAEVEKGATGKQKIVGVTVTNSAQKEKKKRHDIKSQTLLQSKGKRETRGRANIRRPKGAANSVQRSRGGPPKTAKCTR